MVQNDRLEIYNHLYDNVKPKLLLSLMILKTDSVPKNHHARITMQIVIHIAMLNSYLSQV